MAGLTGEEVGIQFIPISMAMGNTTIISDKTTASEMISKSITDDLGNETSATLHGAVQVRLPTSVLGTEEDNSLEASIVEEDSSSLNIVEDQPGIAGQYPSIIYVNSGDGQITVPSDGGILLGGDPNNAPFNLETILGPHQETDHQEIGAGPDDREDAALIQAASNSISASNIHHKLITISPQSLTRDTTSIQNIDGTLASVLDSGALQGMMLKTSTGDTMQVVALQNLPHLNKSAYRLVQVVPTNIMLQGSTLNTGDSENEDQGAQVLDLGGAGVQLTDSLAGILVAAPTVAPKTLPPGTPSWAAQLNDCEKIGDSYRGWVETETDLDLILTFHKQQTHSFWGTRQSPTPSKPSTRLMWKSQYVPFDGIPFINAGSRAIVLECQFGPRRKGAQAKKQAEAGVKSEFRQTCPARIYVKKVRKFPEYAVDINNPDKKLLKLEMDKAFMSLRERGFKSHGHERYYVQLPTENAHEFHGGDQTAESPCRLHPQVTDRIRELVAAGETRLYAIRKALRKYVEKELFPFPDDMPEKHNLTFYPTVNDLQNHIHQAIRDIEGGVLPLSASTVKVEVITGDSSNDEMDSMCDNKPFPVWQHLSNTGHPHTESVTVTLTQNAEDDGQHVISKVETHLSDGTTQITTNLTPETARLLSKLHPNMFAAAESAIPSSVCDSDSSDPLGIASLSGANQVDDGELSPSSPHAQFVIMESSDSDVHLSQAASVDDMEQDDIVAATVAELDVIADGLVDDHDVIEPYSDSVAMSTVDIDVVDLGNSMGP